MIPIRLLLPVLLLAVAASILPAAELTLTAPLDYQVVQRSSPGKGLLRLAGELSEEVPAAEVTIEARLVGEDGPDGVSIVEVLKGEPLPRREKPLFWKIEAP